MLNRKVILVTGASSGFGKIMAGLLANQGHIVYGTSRKAMDNRGKVQMLQMDVTDKMSVQGRKPLISNADEESVLAAIKADRQNVQAAKAAWEASSGKSVSRLTFQRFLKSLADDINV